MRVQVMRNVFASSVAVHRRFDLKGSAVGRTTDGASIRRESMNADDFDEESVILKDLDVDRARDSVFLTPAHAALLRSQLRIDCAFLEELEIVDYRCVCLCHGGRGVVETSY